MIKLITLTKPLKKNKKAVYNKKMYKTTMKKIKKFQHLKFLQHNVKKAVLNKMMT